MPVLVPLDGSPEAESALPVAAAIARRTGAPLELVRLNPAHAIDRSFLPGRWTDAPSDPSWRISYISACLRETARRIMPGGESVVSTLVLDGPPQEVLSAFLDRFSGLVVVAATGDGPAAGTLGRLAECSLRCHEGPVLLVPPTGADPRRAPDWHCERMLVAQHDGVASHGMLAPVATLARAFGSKVILAGPEPRSQESSLADAMRVEYLAEAPASEHMGDWPGETGFRVEPKRGQGPRDAFSIAAVAASLDAHVIVIGPGDEGGHRGQNLAELLTLAAVPVLSLTAPASAALAGTPDAAPAAWEQRPAAD